jgi:hypothetical protein
MPQLNLFSNTSCLTFIFQSVAELIQFEALENAAENHDSFMSTVSYANRLWTSRPSSLMPPSSFEQADGTDDDDSARKIHKVNGIDAGCGDFQGEGDLNDSNLLIDLIDSGGSVGHKTAPPFDPETEDSDDDTRSLASVSQFHASLPIIMSTPSMKIGKKKVVEEESSKEDHGDDVRNSLPASNLVRKLFPYVDQEKSTGHVVRMSPLRSILSEKRILGESMMDKKEEEKHFPTRLRDARINTARTINVGDGVLTKQLQDKLGELKIEIAKFRSENAKLTKGRLECDSVSSSLLID